MIPTDAQWLHYATMKIDDIRRIIREECPEHQEWPIWINGRDVRFPGDDCAAPQAAANDRTLIFR